MFLKEEVRETLTIRTEFRKGVSKENLLKKHEKFHEKFEHLFEMITSTDCDDSILLRILKARTDVEDGKINQHDASVAVGTILVDEIVKPNLPPKED